ncbi:hypothetical protein [Cyclobacterium sp.]|uniref:hypothetical protein n=1 Tax=Cyclobacterium sp. TaxID=1966343 RepID=UPI001993DB2F|nr:hypothetical protein [Cyclobacterium sp.]MBD3630709.1 hypothetical protein [Cyclobacterium sp.]
MKNSKNFTGIRLIIFLGLSMGILVSCVDQPIEGPVGTGNPQDIEHLQASSFFDWKTTEQVTVLVKGLSANIDISRTLTFETENGNEFYAGVQQMGADFEMTFDLPAYAKEVTMIYGAIEKKAEISNKQVSFDFIIDRDNDDIEP